MAKVKPFRGVLYDPTVVKDVAQVVAPPYDVIDSAGQAALHARHPNNVIRLELGVEQPTDGSADNRYTRAAAFLREWLRTGALRRDSQPAIYPYAVDYHPPSGAGTKSETLRGFLVTAAVEEFGTGHIYPHENTRAAAKADRLELLQACRANFSPIWSLYSDPDGTVHKLVWGAVDGKQPRIDFKDDEGFRQRVWEVSDPGLLQQITQAMAGKPLFIADGHHRYETALTYRRMRRQQAGSGKETASQPYDSVLMLLSGMEDEGLTVLPTHRVLTSPLPAVDEIGKQLQGIFDIEVLSFTIGTEPAIRARFLETLRTRGEQGHSFGLVLRRANAYLILTMRAEAQARLADSPRDRLDVSILHNEILNRLGANTTEEGSIIYTKDDQEAIDLVQRGTHPAAVLLNPTKVDEVRAVAAVGERMPHKSTYFYPKPLTGLVINVMEE